MSRTFGHDGIGFHYDVLGDGPAVVFCHGLGGDSIQGPDLAGEPDGYRLVIWDARGHGRTEPLGPPEAFSFATFAADLRALLDHVGIDRAVIAGVSMGAAVAARFACDRPERVRGLVLIRPAWLNAPLPENLRLFPVAADCMAKFGLDKGLAEFRKLPDVQALKTTCRQVYDSLSAQFAAPGALERCVRLQNLPNDCPVTDWDELKRWSFPVLVVGNEPDATHPIAFARQWARRCDTASMVEIPAKSVDLAGHHEVFRAHLRWFMESLEP